MKFKSQQGFVHMLLIPAAIAVLGVTGGAGYYVYHKHYQHAKPSASSQPSRQATGVVETYEDCTKAAGSKQFETYPPTCVTKDGLKFVQAQPQPQREVQKYLTIKEWGIKLPLTSDIADAYYSPPNNNMVHVSTRTLQRLDTLVSGCRSGIDDIYLVRSASLPSDAYVGQPQRIGGYYYYQSSVIEPGCIAATDNSYVTQIQPIQKSLDSSIQHVIATNQ